MNTELLRIAGVILWWGEGSKSRRDKRWKNAVSYPIEITNTNQEIIITFINYLVCCIGIPKERLKLQLQIHNGDDQKELEMYWSKITGIPTERFNKTIVRPIGNKVGKNKGTCKIRCYDKVFYSKIIYDLEQVKKEII